MQNPRSLLIAREADFLPETCSCKPDLDDYIRIHFGNGRPVLTLMIVKLVLEKLPPEKFKRIHRSFIVPLGRISSVLNKKLTLDNNTELLICDSYIASVNEWMQQGR